MGRKDRREILIGGLEEGIIDPGSLQPSDLVDEEIMLAAASHDGERALTVSPTMRNNFIVVLQAVRTSPDAYNLASQQMKRHPAILSALIRGRPF